MYFKHNNLIGDINNNFIVSSTVNIVNRLYIYIYIYLFIYLFILLDFISYRSNNVDMHKIHIYK